MWIIESTIPYMFYFKKKKYIFDLYISRQDTYVLPRIDGQRGVAGKNVFRTVEYQTWYFDRDDSWKTLRHTLPCDVFSVTCYRDDVPILIFRYIFPSSRCTSVCERWPWGPLTVAHRSVVTLYSFLFTLLC